MSQHSIYTFAKWQVKDGELDNVLNLLTEVVRKSTEEEGNLFYKVHRNISNPNILILFEGYTDEGAVQEHRQSDYFQQIVLAQIIPKLESREVMLASLIDLF